MGADDSLLGITFLDQLELEMEKSDYTDDQQFNYDEGTGPEQDSSNEKKHDDDDDKNGHDKELQENKRLQEMVQIMLFEKYLDHDTLDEHLLAALKLAEDPRNNEKVKMLALLAFEGRSV